MRKLMLLVEADANDADYVTRETEVTYDQWIEFTRLLRKVGKGVRLDIIKGLTKEETEDFWMLVPNNDGMSVHTITRAELRYVEEVATFKWGLCFIRRAGVE